MLIIPSVDALGRQRLESPLIQLLDTVATNPTIQTAIAARLQQLSAEYPNDVAVAVTQAAWDLKYGGDAGAGSIDRIVQVLADNPLEAIPAGRRPNSRLRATAAERIPVWLLARECLKRSELQDRRPAVGGCGDHRGRSAG